MAALQRQVGCPAEAFMASTRRDGRRPRGGSMVPTSAADARRRSSARSLTVLRGRRRGTALKEVMAAAIAGRSPLCPVLVVRFGHANHTSTEAPSTTARHPGRPAGAGARAGHRPPRAQHAPDPGPHQNWGNPQPYGRHSPLEHPAGVTRAVGSGLSVFAFVHALAHAEAGDSAMPKPAATTRVSSRSATA